MSEKSLPTVIFRRARPADREAIERLLAASGLPLAGVPEHLGDFLLAATAGGIVATAAVEPYPPVGLLRSVAVDPAQRGRGLGALLTARAVERARRSGLTALYLLTTTAPDYFPRFGFRAVPRPSLPAALGASEELRGACPEGAVCMELRLEPAPSGGRG